MATNPDDIAIGFETRKLYENRSSLVGITKREYFAAMAMQGAVAGHNAEYHGAYLSYEDAAIIAVKHADALIRALNSE